MALHTFAAVKGPPDDRVKFMFAKELGFRWWRIPRAAASRRRGLQKPASLA